MREEAVKSIMTPIVMLGLAVLTAPEPDEQRFFACIGTRKKHLRE
jgi:hypothetical protein